MTKCNSMHDIMHVILNKNVMHDISKHKKLELIRTIFANSLVFQKSGLPKSIKLSEQICITFSDSLHDTLCFKIFPSNLFFSVLLMDHFCKRKPLKYSSKSSVLVNISQVFFDFC